MFPSANQRKSRTRTAENGSLREAEPGAGGEELAVMMQSRCSEILVWMNINRNVSSDKTSDLTEILIDS